MISIKKLLIKLLNLEYYTSHTDQFLATYSETHPKKSHAQHQEISKYQRLNKMRDQAVPVASNDKFWDKF